MSQTTLAPELLENVVAEKPYMVVLYDDDVTPINRVITTIIRATGCDVEEAYLETWEAEHFGKSRIHFASQEECLRAVGVLRQIGLTAEVLPEWND